MDEKGTALGATESHQVIVRANQKLHDQFKRAVGGAQWVTIVETVSLSGRVVPPYIMFEGTKVDATTAQPYTQGKGKPVRHIIGLD